MSVDKIVTSTQFAIGKPSHITMLECAGFDGIEILVPGDEVLCKPSPELSWILNRVFVEFLVLLQPVDVWSRLTFLELWRIEFFRISGFENNLASVSMININELRDFPFCQSCLRLVDGI